MMSEMNGKQYWDKTDSLKKQKDSLKELEGEDIACDLLSSNTKTWKTKSGRHKIKGVRQTLKDS